MSYLYEYGITITSGRKKCPAILKLLKRDAATHVNFLTSYISKTKKGL